MNNLAIAGCTLVALSACCGLATWRMIHSLTHNNETDAASLLGPMLATHVLIFGVGSTLCISFMGIVLIVTSLWVDV